MGPGNPHWRSHRPLQTTNSTNNQLACCYQECAYIQFQIQVCSALRVTCIRSRQTKCSQSISRKQTALNRDQTHGVIILAIPNPNPWPWILAPVSYAYDPYTCRKIGVGGQVVQKIEQNRRTDTTDRKWAVPLASLSCRYVRCILCCCATCLRRLSRPIIAACVWLSLCVLISAAATAAAPWLATVGKQTGTCISSIVMSTAHHGKGKFQDLLKFFRIDRPQLYGNHRFRQQDYKRCCAAIRPVCLSSFSRFAHLSCVSLSVGKDASNA